VKEEDEIINLIATARHKSHEYLKILLKGTELDDLNPSDGKILAILYKHSGSMEIRDIRNTINRSKSTVTDMVNRLEKLGYVYKKCCSEDKRVVFVNLTEKAFSLKKSYEIISKKLLEKSYSNFSQEEKKEFMKLLEKIISNF